mgnify:FL=1
MAQSERPPRGDGRCGKEGGVAARAGDTVPIGRRRPALSRSAGFTSGCARVAAPSYSGPVHQALADHLRIHALRTGDFTLRSGARSSWYVDARATTFTGEGAALAADAVLSVLLP